ncbi:MULTISPECIES: HAD-IB family hydrolase [unclassified Corynebacterium]|uniref:HAD family hydrolase n=1 Tax=unclassified Corynebacterium TaxID=2624378 RepID=UPI001EF50A5F|nr:HAD-IB family hydrolase [Corynebacterium sp. ACRQK]MCG7262916.1 HAD-IB family hydrolase [Corynebacterium sp. ACRQL]
MNEAPDLQPSNRPTPASGRNEGERADLLAEWRDIGSEWRGYLRALSLTVQSFLREFREERFGKPRREKRSSDAELLAAEKVASPPKKHEHPTTTTQNLQVGYGTGTPQALWELSKAQLDQLAHSYAIKGDQLRTGLANLEGAGLSAEKPRHLDHPDPSIPQDAGVGAFFDVDNTLIKGASILLFARGLAKRRFFTAQQLLGFIWVQMKFRMLGKESADDISSGREQALALVKGRKESEVTEMAQEIWAATIAERIFPDTKELADMHIQAGQQVWLVTASPVQLAQIIAKELGFTGALGTVAEVKDGRFTGRMVGHMLHGEEKKHAVIALANYEGLDLQRCTAYSDSVNDLPMLSTVGTAVAINPDSKLRKAALERGWEIRDYRRMRRAFRRIGGARLAAGAGLLGLAGGASMWARKRR